MKSKVHSNFILDFQNDDYPYMEEVNEGIVKQVAARGNGASILDVGAGRGALGEALCDMGYYVCAIEANEMAASVARAKVDQVILSDLHDIEEINRVILNKKFQYIIFSDVLEHVFDPLAVLRMYLPLLAEDGKLLVSLPNAVNWLNRFLIMLGMFNYKMTGVMDRTHMRFFTHRSAKKMLEASECLVEKMDSTPFIVRAFLPIIKALLNNNREKADVKHIIESPSYQLYKKYVYPIEYWFTRMVPSLLAFRIILVASRRNCCSFKESK